MRKILKQLNQEVGVKGSLVAGPDGLVVMAELGEELEDDIVAAMASNTIRTTKQALELLGSKRFDRFVLIAPHGRIVLVDIDPAILLVVTDKNINIDHTIMAINGAAHRLSNVWKI